MSALVHEFLLLYTQYYMSPGLTAQQGINQLLSITETCHQPWLDGMALLEDREQNKHSLSTGCERFV